VSWLRELAPHTKKLNELADELTAIGTAVQWIKPLWTARPGIKAVRVVASEPHPKADRLSVCRIDTGDGEHSLVCGAPNVRAGMMAVWVPPGAALPDGTVIEKRAVRGVESAGMLCSEAELGLSHVADTIVELPSEVTPGTPAEELFNDDIISFELTPNRPDCMATFGIAREVGALTGKPFRIPEFDRGEESGDLGNAIDIRGG
jgi:phenylalanyl-tRNA synthetase beta chain